MIKKRLKPANLRKVTSDDNNDQLTEEMSALSKESDFTSLALIKAEQEMRKVRGGLSIETGGGNSKAVMDTSARYSGSASQTKTIGSMISTQFSSTGDSSQSLIPHEKIMEAYINERLGIRAESEG
jgi:hypothetical protein